MRNIQMKLDNNVSTFAILITLTSISMLFGTFISSYFVLKIRLIQSIGLPKSIFYLGFINTTIILISSFCMYLSIKNFNSKDFFNHIIWLRNTFILGIIFVGGQLGLWFKMNSIGIKMTFGQLSDIIYLISIIHAIHLFFGLFILFWVLKLPKKSISKNLLFNVGLYWHFLSFLWFFSFLLTFK